ncbi:MAG: tetratricopeptide repeat protein [Spirochaetota bacterium]
MKSSGVFFINLIIMMHVLLWTGPSAGAEATAVGSEDAQSSAKQQGIEFFMDNQPEQAAPLLQTALRQEPRNDKLYMYLAVCYEQMGDFEAAQQIYQDGLPYAGSSKARFYYNMGVNYQRLEEYDRAAEMYQQALELNKDMANAYLNRANLYVRKGQFNDAVADYQVFLSLRPNSSQRENIEQMIDLLNKKVVDAERQRLEEERKREEEERRQQELLEQVLGSLEQSGEETKNLSAGTGEVKEYEQEFDIVD